MIQKGLQYVEAESHLNEVGSCSVLVSRLREVPFLASLFLLCFFSFFASPYLPFLTTLQDGTEIECDEAFTLLIPHVCKVKNVCRRPGLYEAKPVLSYTHTKARSCLMVMFVAFGPLGKYAKADHSRLAFNTGPEAAGEGQAV
jgi:hypothetical protein